MKNLIVVYNSKSGGALTKSKLEGYFATAGLEPMKYWPLDGKLQRRLSRHLKNNPTIAVVGGDGTMSSLADMIAGTGATLAPLPGGTLNHFAGDLGIPQDIGDAIKRLATAKRHKVDVASVNNVSFVNNSSIGLYPSSLRIRSRLESRFGKWPAAIIGSMRALIRFKVYRLKINKQIVMSSFVFIGNNQYQLDGAGVPQRTHLNRGVLSVYVAHVSSRWQLFVVFLRTLSGSHHEVDNLEAFTVKTELIIETTKRSITVSHDGEVDTMSSHLTYRIHRKNLWVI